MQRFTGVSAQSCADTCVAAVTTDDERLCKAGMSCINALPSAACGNDKKEEAKRKLIEKGCSGSGIPIISAMSLFVVALFHML